MLVGVTVTVAVGVGGGFTINVASSPVVVELTPVLGSTAEISAVPGPTACTWLLFGAAFGAIATS